MYSFFPSSTPENKMTPTQAVTRSISHTECVSITLNLAEALAALTSLGLEGYTDIKDTDTNAGRADVWGTLDGQEWRLNVVYA